MSDKDRARREAGGRAVARGMADNIRLFARVTNTLVKEKEVEDRWRKLPTPDHARHLANHVEPEVVDALRRAVQAAYPRLSHRYYAMKARWLGLDRLEFWDRNAPLPDADDRTIPWDEARATVLDAYARLQPAHGRAGRALLRPRLDRRARQARQGARRLLALDRVDVHPYVMLNYLGKPRDVMTLAHELGHGVHQRLAAAQGELLSRTPLTLAETASVFGEMLTFQRMLAQAPDARIRKAMLAGKVEDMLNTVVRQIAFYEFERRIHAARREGELTTDADRRDLDGRAVREPRPGDQPARRVPHLLGLHPALHPLALLRLRLCLRRRAGERALRRLRAGARRRGFQDRYFEMLSAGGTLHHSQALAPFGLDASDPAFWDKGLGLIGRMIDELEAMG